jgi:hypothetical protein
MPVIGSQNTKINTAEKQAAYNLHYVNIAPAHLFLACVFVSPGGGAALAGFVFTAKNQPTQKQKPACAA